MSELRHQAQAVSNAARVMRTVSTDQKNQSLTFASVALLNATEPILEANAIDVQAAIANGLNGAAIDRLSLNEARLKAMADGIMGVVDLKDPVGEITETWTRPNGLEISRVRAPLGVVGIIYENRPNVTSDAGALCVKSGNAAFLRGSSAALNSNVAIVEALRSGLERGGLPRDAIGLVADTSRESAVEFMQLRGFIDCLIPRGGPDLIASILKNATVPFVVDGDGNCHVYVHRAADMKMAIDIVVNSKTHRPGVCNAAESVVVDAEIAADFLPRLHNAMPQVELLGDDRACQILADIGAATEQDFAREFLDLKMTVAVVGGIDQAIDHISRFSSGHTEAIVTQDAAAANQFVCSVDAAAVNVNASTRFTDGEAFGFGAEIGISTQKLHCRGPMGLRELTSQKYVVRGNGQVRS